MTDLVDTVNTTVEILGKSYSVRSPETDVDALQAAANYLNEKMLAVKQNSGNQSIDSIAIITALNITHELFCVEQKQDKHDHQLTQYLNQLKSKLDDALSRVKQPVECLSVR